MFQTPLQARESCRLLMASSADGDQECVRRFFKALEWHGYDPKDREPELDRTITSMYTRTRWTAVVNDLISILHITPSEQRDAMLYNCPGDTTLAQVMKFLSDRSSIHG